MQYSCKLYMNGSYVRKIKIKASLDVQNIMMTIKNPNHARLNWLLRSNIMAFSSYINVRRICILLLKRMFFPLAADTTKTSAGIILHCTVISGISQ